MKPTDLSKFFIQCQEIMYQEVRNVLTYLGEECVKKVRERGYEESWIDRTGNLRSSIGYAVFEEGKNVMQSQFYVVKEGSEGQQAGRQMIEDLASLYSNAFALVVVAGMEYAEDVEALDSKDVLASTEIWAKSVIEERLNMAMERAAKRIDAL